MENSLNGKSRLGKQYLHIVETDSTNDVLMRLIEDGVTVEATETGGRLIEGVPTEGTVVSADSQTAGRGRRGRTWTDKKGLSLLFSVLLEPEVEVNKVPMVTIVAAMGVCKTIREMYELDALIKWPNDIVIGGKKVCGILTELKQFAGHNYAVVGIGVNVAHVRFSEELAVKATSLYIETDKTYERENLLFRILENIEKYYDMFLDAGDLSKMVDEYVELMAGRDSLIKVYDQAETIIGKALGIDSNGYLIVKDEGGTVHNIFAGETSIGGIYGE